MSDALKLVLSTRFGEWIADGQLERVLRRLVEAGWIRRPTWMQTNWKARPRPVLETGEDAVAQILSLVPRDASRARALEVGGEAPHWALHLLLAPFVPGADRAAGIHVLSVDLPANVDRSLLVPNFEAIARERVTEYASLHPEQSDERLERETGRDPAFTGQLFPCLFWCNFLGQTILQEFRADAPETCLPASVQRKRLSGSGGVILIAMPTAEEASSPEGERQLLEWTERFREARVHG